VLRREPQARIHTQAPLSSSDATALALCRAPRGTDRRAGVAVAAHVDRVTHARFELDAVAVDIPRDFDAIDAFVASAVQRISSELMLPGTSVSTARMK
jgi:hypothetical protein